MSQAHRPEADAAAAQAVASMQIQQWLQFAQPAANGEDAPPRGQGLAGISAARGQSPAIDKALSNALGPMAPTAISAAQAAGVPLPLIAGALSHPKGGDVLAVAHTPEQKTGPMQISQAHWQHHTLPGLTAQDKHAIKQLTGKAADALNMNNPRDNVVAGVFELKQMLAQNGADPRRALAEFQRNLLGIRPEAPAGQAALSLMESLMVALNELERRQALRPAPRAKFNSSSERAGGGHEFATASPRSAAAADAPRPSHARHTASPDTPPLAAADGAAAPTTKALPPPTATNAAPPPQGQTSLAINGQALQPGSPWGLQGSVQYAKNITLGEGAMRIAIPQGSSNPGQAVDGGALMHFAPAGVHGASAVTLSYDVALSDNFDFNNGGKLWGGVKIGEGAASGGRHSDDGASYRVTWGEHGELHLYAYNMLGQPQTAAYQGALAHRGDQYGDHLFSGLFLRKGEPNHVSLSVTCSTRDPSTGQWRGDGTLSLTLNGQTRTVSNVVVPGPVNEFVSATFMGGKWENRVNSHIDISNVSYSAG
jgi:hypothetical protein